jgi:hypothetical protein
MEHKAFEFQWSEFERELLPILLDALCSRDERNLCLFIGDNRGVCFNPYQGCPLGPDWRDQLENNDVQEVGDYAITKYYDPTSDFGLGRRWIEMSDVLTGQQRASFLGFVIGPDSNLFDPGRMGSYFQDADTVSKSLASLSTLVEPELRDFVDFLEAVKAHETGIYVTF